MPIRASIICPSVRKNRPPVAGCNKVGTEPLHIGFRLFVESPSTHLPPRPETQAVGVFLLIGHDGAITQPSQTWIRRMRINVLNGASRSLMMGIHYRASAKPSLQKTASKLDKRDDCSSYPSYNG